MQTITLILSVLAFLAATAALFLTVKERRRSWARFEESRNGNRALRKALADYATKKAEIAASRAAAAVREDLEKVSSRIDKTNKVLRQVNLKADAARKAAKENADRIEDLERGVIPDFEEARRAVDAVNDVNKGIAGIFGFDPMEALKKSRQESD